jgi:thiosulfate dehydrogenase [quinone] large subunit
MRHLTGLQQFLLVVLRTLIGWHFAYEGFYKLMLPGWTRGGERVAAWSAEGYLRAASGPLSPLFRSLVQHPSAMHAVDLLVPLGLLLVGLSLMLGFFTQLGCAGAMVFLSMFYLSAPPITGLPQTGAEGTYLYVNKNLIEFVALATIMAFRTGTIAGLDQYRLRRRRLSASPQQM